MRITPYSTSIAKGEVFAQGYSSDPLWRVVDWETYKGVSQITLEAIDCQGQKLGRKNMKVLSCHWMESQFEKWPFEINEQVESHGK